jgi:hypothetical protein
MCPHDSKPEPWDRIDRTREESWEEFAARNTDLLCWNPSVLARFYSDDVLQSDASRRGVRAAARRLVTCGRRSDRRRARRRSRVDHCQT